jgi:uncharacterized protein (DUF1800 family)
MRRATTSILLALLLLAAAPAREGVAADTRPTVGLPLPWREAGWSEREAAAHLLDRLAFGARPGEVDRVVAMGLETWVEGQLAAALPESGLEHRLASLPALGMTAAEIAETYPPGFAVRRMAVEAGVVSRAEIERAEASDEGSDQRELRRRIAAWMRSRGLRSERELLAQSYAQKLLRAAYAENQLAEVLADFWFNHFNVSITDNPVRGYLLAYERDALRPHLLGRFRDLLEATAKHPAMLLYLDNFQSVAAAGQPTTFDRERRRRGFDRRFAAGIGGPASAPPRPERPNRPQGLNENYARELLELHTLGVDGGYGQQDVVEVARALTGWTLLPAGARGERGREGLERARRAGGLGFVREGDFVFRADAHDAGAKTVLGVRLPAGRGVEDGEQVLDLVAAHPSTARHLATKLAIRFVADEPPADLVDRLAGEFAASGGDLRRMLAALVAAPEFWAREARAAKIKSPFEVAVSALRALGAEVTNPLPTLEWITAMGQPLYACQAPTGFPDRAEHWVNTGALLSRMNFGLELASGRVAGVRFELATFDAGKAPESAETELETYARQLLPERDVAATMASIGPLLADREVQRKVAERAPNPEPAPWDLADPFADLDAPSEDRAVGGARRRARAWAVSSELFPAASPMTPESERPTPLAGVVGLLLGSPEFQRR